MIYISSENAETSFDEAKFLGNLEKKVRSLLDWSERVLTPWDTVLVCHWSACTALNWADWLLGTVPDIADMPIQYKLAVAWLDQSEFEYRIVHVVDRTRIEVKLPKERFMATFIPQFESMLAYARNNTSNAPYFESGDKIDDVNALVVDWELCFRTLKQRILGEPPLEENMPEHAKWVLEWLRGKGFHFEFEMCGGFQGRPTNWGVFVKI